MAARWGLKTGAKTPQGPSALEILNPMAGKTARIAGALLKCSALMRWK
jgi:hypothetical protein